MYLLTVNSNNSLFVYALRIGTTSIDSVYQSVSYNQTASTAPNNYLFALAGTQNTDWVILLDKQGNKTSAWQVNESPVVTIVAQSFNNIANPSAQNYLESYPYMIQASGGYNPTNLTANFNLNVINSEVQVIASTNSNSNGAKLSTNGTKGLTQVLTTTGLFQGAVFSYMIGNTSSPFSLIQTLSQYNTVTSNVISNGYYYVVDTVYVGNAAVLLLFSNSTLVYYNYITNNQTNLGTITPTDGFSYCTTLKYLQLNGLQYAYRFCLWNTP